MKLRATIAALTCSLACLAGCGAAPTATKPTRPRAQSSAPAPQILPMPNPFAGGEAAGEGAALLTRLREAFDTCTGAEAEAKSYSEGHWKAGKKVAELRTATYRMKMLWVKPRKIRGEILETDNFLVGAAKMVTLDGKKVKVRAGGVLGLVPLTLDTTDDMLGSNRRHKFNQQTPDAISERLLGTQATWTVVGQATIAGTPCKLVEVSGVPKLDSEIEREVVAVDPAAGTLRGVSMYAKGKKVTEVTFTKFRWNPKPAADAFEL